VCDDEACTGTCTPGTTRCQANPNRREVCVGGEWETEQACPSGSECVNDGAECRKSNGGSCTSDINCASGFCVDGVCCGSRCGPVSCTSHNTECMTYPASVS